MQSFCKIIVYVSIQKVLWCTLWFLHIFTICIVYIICVYMGVFIFSWETLYCLVICNILPFLVLDITSGPTNTVDITSQSKEKDSPINLSKFKNHLIFSKLGVSQLNQSPFPMIPSLWGMATWRLEGFQYKPRVCGGWAAEIWWILLNWSEDLQAVGSCSTDLWPRVFHQWSVPLFWVQLLGPGRMRGRSRI